MHGKLFVALLVGVGTISAWIGSTTPGSFGPDPTIRSLAITGETDPGGAATPFIPTTTPPPTTAPATSNQPTSNQPTSTPPASTPPTSSERPPRGRLVISGAGDTNLDPNYIPTFVTTGYEHAFSGLQGIFEDDDLTVVNFECAASELGAPVPKAFTFNCDLAALPVMRNAGVEVASLANNHGRDYGEEALLDSKANLIEAGLIPVGVGRNAAEASAPALFDINGWTIAVIGFNGVIPAADWIATDDRPGMADGDTIETMVAAVEAADEVAELVIVTIHWGVELDTTPRADDVARAQAMIAAGADMIFGHHSHRLNPLEFLDGKPVAWGLGNFVWPRLSDAGATSAIAQVIVEPDGSIEACLIPVFIESHGHPVVQVDYQGLCRW